MPLRMMIYLLVIALSLCIVPPSDAVSRCQQTISTCASCINSDPRCAWDPKSDILSAWRCLPADDLRPELFSPKSTVQELVPNRQFDLKLRRGDSKDIFFEVELEQQALVDLYILSDMSFTMMEALKAVGQASAKMREVIGKKAGRVRLGFGGFTEKPTLPFVHFDYVRVCQSSQFSGYECAAPFSYQHFVNFTTNETHFRQTLNEQKLTVNVDNPEGGLDALLQVAVCSEIIKWDPSAERIVAFLTNGGLHTHGDGLLAGITKSPDLRCHMGLNETSGKMEYLEALNFDYPSIGMVADALAQNGISVIFIVDEKVLPLYRQLAKALPSANVAKLPKGSPSDDERIAEIMRDNHNKITRLVTFDTNTSLEADSKIQITVAAKCSPNGEWLDSSECENIRLGGNVTFRVTVTAKECLTSAQQLQFYSQAVPNAVLDISVDTLCSCAACTTPSDPEVCGAAAVVGESICGDCKCPENRSGIFCECSASDKPSDENCKSPEGADICGGHGNCSCGKCQCVDGYAGDFCEHATNCHKDIFHARVCGGALRGRCLPNGTCACLKGFTGEACDCFVKDDGETDCRKKVSTEVLRSEKTCSNTRIRKCVICHHKKTPPGLINADRACSKECELSEGVLHLTMNDSFSSNHKWTHCVVDFDEDCLIRTAYERREKYIAISVLRRCHFAFHYADAIPLIIGVVSAVLLLGAVIIIIWKVIAYLEDKAEYMRLLEDERRFDNQMNSNPLYQSPETKVWNPLFQGDSADNTMSLN